MTRHDDFTGLLESYLDDYEGYTPLPESVRSAVRASLPTVRQRGPRRGPERFASMALQLPPAARYGLVAAVVLAAAVLGAGVFGGFGGVGGPPGDASAQPSPSASSEPTSEPTPEGTSLLDSPDRGDLPPGRYYLDIDAYPARIEFEVPEGWWYFWGGITREDSDVHAILVNSEDTGAANGSAWGLAFAMANVVRVDPCDPDAGEMDPSVTESANTLAAAFSSWADFPVTSVEDVSIGGYSGKRVELDTTSSPCNARLFITPGGYSFEAQRARPNVPAQPEQYTFLDVEGSVLVIWTTDYAATNYFEVDGGASFDPQAHAEDQVELRAILDSIVIEPRAAASD